MNTEIIPKTESKNIRPPIVVVVGHIDHGKSTLLDYIRHTNLVERETGGITQHLSAYEATHTTSSGDRMITFLDTPGHEAFAAMRSRGLSAADIAILVVSAEDGVKPQTLEAVKLITEAKIPYIVALTKIDKPGANIERAKASLIEHGIYLEGMGGDIPYTPVSGKTGEGISELLDLILLVAELQELKVDYTAAASGLVIEAHIDPKRGASATLIVKNGSLKAGEYVVAGSAHAPVRIMENFLGKSVKEALPGSPIRIVGFSSVPKVGTEFHAVQNKKEAEEKSSELGLQERKQNLRPQTSTPAEDEPVTLVLPVVIKTDVAGVGDAIEHELQKLPKYERLEVRVVSRGVGTISEADVKLAAGSERPGLVIGFNVKVDSSAQDLAERLGVGIQTFTVIYTLAEWLGKELEKRRPRERTEEKTGTARIIKLFSKTKHTIVIGGKVEEGSLELGEEIRLLRRDLELGRGSIESLQSQKTPVKKIEASNEFGAMLKTDVEIAPGDRIEAFEIVLK